MYFLWNYNKCYGFIIIIIVIVNYHQDLTRFFASYMTRP